MALLDAIQAIQFLIENEDAQIIDLICKSKTSVELIMKFLRSENAEHHGPSIKVLGHVFSSDNEDHINVFLCHGVLDAINALMHEH